MLESLEKNIMTIPIFKITRIFDNDDTSESSEFHYGIRMYASNLILSYCIVTEDMWTTNGFDLSPYIPTPYDYVVVRDKDPLKNGCTSLGYDLMDTVDGYAVFRRGNAGENR